MAGRKKTQIIVRMCALSSASPAAETPVAVERKKGDSGKKAEKTSKKTKNNKEGGGKGGGAAGELAITSQKEDYSQWYLDVIASAALAEQSPVKGCAVIRPHGYAIWELLQREIDDRLKARGVQNAYFPLLIPQSFLSKEAEHVDGFAKECAVVTHHRLRAAPANEPNTVVKMEPDPDAELEEPLVIRPTSETIIWHMFGRWIQSYRDLPLVVNQWANVMRWEMRTRPFLRSAEFLWQEGHTAHADEQEAKDYAREMAVVYSEVCEKVLAVPTVIGEKSPSERFAGAENTFCIEALMPNGWALQAGTAHFLGQNFAKAFDVTYSAENGARELVWASSWGVSTRLLGGLIMTHSDDTGLVLPPTVAPVQVVVIPIAAKSDEAKAVVNPVIDRVVAELRAVGVRVKVDDREKVRPGAKFFEWERKGVPLRIEIGPRDVARDVILAKHRVPLLTQDKIELSLTDEAGSVADAVAKELDSLQDALLSAAKNRLARGTVAVSSYEEMVSRMEQDGLENGIGLYEAAWCCDAENERKIKEECKATIRCYPLDAQDSLDGRTCFYSGRPATHLALFARAY
eukprot:CAMPEP_0185848742 /NCGR_PEP_ID=MMETSP1354-20130828/3504_1 /TAXON_ID=708628 /ORGANISM="Erythrolobus madagascarensis, Strain CCMP3276" /LENGTH=572 /DNA_ID=CAMNT_0028549179 /DNA_START=105 /DNA_END=1823 /DNA_ORIENTATION=-